ncbi:MAG: IPT/TIG domain-containing protein [Candidatus Marinimicrobia bacterium]|nr:IPT/TIG domain-containing protein [Candidatus Neomarinimicrobiota bacterium]
MRKPLIIFVLISLFIGLSCNTEEPDSIFGPRTVDPNPVITSVTPPDSAYGGADERYTVTIVGQYFGDNADEVLVNFGSELAVIRSHSATKLVVTPPVNFSDSLRIMISKFGSNASWEFGLYEQGDTVFRPYKLMDPTSVIPGYDQYLEPEGICLDARNNLYVTHGKYVDKINPQGNSVGVGGNAEILKAISTTNIKIGPGDAFYYIYLKYIMKTDTTTFSHTYKKAGYNTKGFDFDENDNLYLVTESAVYSVDIISMEPTLLVEYADTVLSGGRVYGQNLYVMAIYNGENTLMSKTPYIAKYPLDVANGLLSGDLEKVYDWAEAGMYSNAVVTSFTFDFTGTLYVGTSNYSLLQIEPVGGDYSAGTISQVYTGILGGQVAYRIVWDEGKYLYINTRNATNAEKTSLIKVNMFEDGAPYYGRN